MKTEDQNKINTLKEIFLSQDDTDGFIERENAIHWFLQGPSYISPGDCYVSELEYVLDHLTAQIRSGEVILGSMVQGPIPYPMEIVPGDGYTHKGDPFMPYDRCAGHCEPDYPCLLREGLSGIAGKISKNVSKHTKLRKARENFALWSERSALAIQKYAGLWADAAQKEAEKEEGERKWELLRAAAALKKVPYYPAETFFEALQSVWFMHFILSCIVGGRDFAFGRMDQYLQPYYEKDLKEGILTEEEAEFLIGQFLVKCNEAGGRIPVQMIYKRVPDYKPVPCSSSKQYLVLGGCDQDGNPAENDVSYIFFRAARQVKMIEPVIVARMTPSSPLSWKREVLDASQRLQGQVTVFNDDIIVPRLRQLGAPKELAAEYTMTGCNGVCLPGMQNTEKYQIGLQWLVEALSIQNPEEDHILESILSFPEVVERFRTVAYQNIRKVKGADRILPDCRERMRFHLESMLLTQCMDSALDIENGGQEFESVIHFIEGISNIANSFYVIDKLVFREKRVSLRELTECLRKNYKNSEEFLEHIRGMPKFGNDENEVDAYAALAAGVINDVIEQVNHEDERYMHSGGFYALYWQYRDGEGLPATPDGRKKGDPICENMSPSYGDDKNGLTALLNSVSKLDLRRCTTGGLNIKFPCPIPLDRAVTLFDVFFEKGGINYAITVADRESMILARQYPEQYKNLCVRVTGYSEYFTKLPEYVQDELIRRTEAV